jgi:Flp pilus assembly protein TadG
VKKYISIPPSPPRLEGQMQGKAEPKAKERREVGDGNDAVVIGNTSGDEDKEMLQQEFQLRSRFSRARMPNSSVIEKPSILEASLLVTPRKPRNMACKRAVKKLKLSKATKQEVSTAIRVAEY